MHTPPAAAPTDPLVWTEAFRVRAYEAGPDGHAGVLTLCDYVQEAAGEHASAAGVETFDLPDGPGTWILSRLRLALTSRPAMRETVRVVTWPSAHDGLRAERDFVVEAADGTEHLRGVSTWVVLSVARRRPVRLPEAVHAFGPATRARALPPVAADPVAPAEALAEARFTVRLSDLDRVGHANNVRFAEWALEAAARLPAWQGAAPPALATLDLAFRAEATYGDVVVSAVGPPAGASDDTALAHALTRESDGRLLALAASTWRPP